MKPQTANPAYVPEGFILLSRQLLDSRACQSCNNDQKIMLLYCLLKANFKDSIWTNERYSIPIKRGSFVTGRKSFAKLAHTTEQRVRTFWNKMEKVGFLTTKATKHYSVVTICNYDRYQDMKNYNQPTKQPTSNQRVTTSKECKGKINIYEQEFEALLAVYPNKLGKKQALLHFTAARKSGASIQDFQKALDHYKDDLKANPWKKAQHTSTWFNSWEDWLDYKVKPQVKFL